MYAEQKLHRVARHFDRVVEAEVEFARESGRGPSSFCAVQIIVRMDGRRLPLAQAREVAPDPKAALDVALDKVDRQVVKLKEKVKAGKKRVAPDDEALRARADDLRSRAKGGEDPDELLIDSFALTREAARRTIGMRHFDVQLIGGIVLHLGKIAEMKTGEGKTLVATLPLVL